MPKTHVFPLRPCFISGSRVSVAFFVELGARRIVAPTTVPPEQEPAVLEQPADQVEHLLGELMALQKMAAVEDRRFVGDRAPAELDATKRRMASLS